MNQKEQVYGWLLEQWEPLILKFLRQNKVLGLDRDDLAQEIQLVLWECFVRNDVVHFPTYLSKSLHNRIADLYAGAQEFYFPSPMLRCVGCKLAVYQKPKSCPQCEGIKWRSVKGPSVLPLTQDIPFYDNLEVEEYPEEIKGIIENVLSGKKTGYHQKRKLREYLVRNGRY